jgi:hypothetical protein
MFRILTLTMFFAASSIGFAQSPDTEAPKRLLGFFKPGMPVGIQTVEGSSSVIVRTYSDANFAVAKEIAGRGSVTIDAEEIAAKSEPVRAALEQHLKRSNSAASSERSVWLMPLMRTTLGRVKAVGDNYILIEIDGEEKSRMAIADLSISKVYLDVDPIRFLSRPFRSASPSGG